jgi:hypothetical protein
MEFKHPKYYKKLRAANRIRTAPKLVPKSAFTITSNKPQAKPEPSSGSEASSSKPQAPSYKRQA